MKTRHVLTIPLFRFLCFVPWKMIASALVMKSPASNLNMLRQLSVKSKCTLRLRREIPFFNDPQLSISSVSSNVLAEDADDKQQGKGSTGVHTRPCHPSKIFQVATGTSEETGQDSSKIISIDLSKYEEKEKREMEWLVETTAKLLGLEEESRKPAGNMSKQLTRRAFKLMRAWSSRSAEPHVVDLILRRLVTEVAAGNPEVVISTKTYNVVLDAWSHSNLHGCAARCETILDEMERQYANGNLKNSRPNTKSYNSVMKAFVNSDEWKHKAYHKVKTLFERLEKLNCGIGNESNSINRGSYNVMLCAIAESQLRNKGEIAEEYLRAMLGRHAKGDEKVKPNINSYNTVIRAWSATACDGRYREERIDNLFLELRDFGVQPNTDTFNHILGVYLKSNNPNKLDKIDETMKAMEMSFEAGNQRAKPDRVTINTIVAARAKHGLRTADQLGSSLEKKYNIQPDTVSNNILIDCWNKSGRRDAATKAVRVLAKMERCFESGVIRLKPDAYTYASVIDSFAKCGGEGAAESARSVLERMRILHNNHGGDPANVSVYNAVINAWASSQDDTAIEQAMDLLKEMEEGHEVDPFVPKPDTTTFNSILKVLCNGSDQGAIQADEILTKLEQSSEYCPDTISFTTVISAYGRSAIENKAEKAYRILQRMIASYGRGNLSARPNIKGFNSVLNACAFANSGGSKGKVEAFFILVATTRTLNKFGIQSDHTTFGTLLRACSSLLPPGDKRRTELVEGVFRKACREGMVGYLVLKQLKFAASASQYREMLGRNRSDYVRPKDLPASWTCCVRENRRR